MEEDARGGAAAIRQAFAAGRDFALTQVCGRYCAADQAEALTQGHFRRGHMQEFHAERGSDRGAGFVIGRRANATRRHDEIILAPSGCEGSRDFFRFIADDHRTGNRQATAGQLLSQPNEVPILPEAIQQFIPNIKDQNLAWEINTGFHLRGGSRRAGLRESFKNAN